MAIVVRYFGLTAQGTGDGLTWANRAVGFVAGAWSTIITGFNFSLTDSLECRFEAGTHTLTASLGDGVFITPPSMANPLYICSADSSGNKWTPPNPGWRASKPSWDTSGMAKFQQTTISAGFVDGVNTHIWGIYFDTSAQAWASNTPLGSISSTTWCYLLLASGQSEGFSFTNAANCICKSTANYNGLFQSKGNDAIMINCRAEGNPSSNAGSRHGVNNPGAGRMTCVGCVSIDNAGSGFAQGNTWKSASIEVYNCVAYNCGVGCEGAVSGAWYVSGVLKSILVSNATFGIKASVSAKNMRIEGCRLRDNTSGNFANTGNYPLDINNDLSAGTDAAEFVDAVGGDFRIKNTSSLWGKNIGAGDEPASGGGAVTVGYFG